jgi:sugar lactone lactonase YvrE
MGKLISARQVLPGLLLCMALGASTAGAQDLSAIAESRKIFAEAAAARERNDNSEYLRLMREVVKLRPDQPGAQYRLAGALGRTGDLKTAAALLKSLADQGLHFRVENDPDLFALRDSPAWPPIAEAFARNLKPKVASEEAFRLKDRDVLPEGLAYDPKEKTFYVASVRQRRIIARLPDGSEKTFGKGAADGLWSVIALRVDAERRYLWATTAAIEQTRDLDPKDAGRTAVVQYDLDSGKLLKRFEPPRIDRPQVFGDLVVSSSGRVIISEAQQGGLWRVSNGVLEPFVQPGKFASPQGLAFPNQGNWLYVADYSLGLMRVDIATRKVERVKAPAGVTLLGMDGMVRYGNDLIATQNGIRPQRVVRIRLASDGQVAGLDVLEANHPAHAEPTLGTLVGEQFYYVANAQWERFSKGLVAAEVVPPVILKLPLPSLGTR